MLSKKGMSQVVTMLLTTLIILAALAVITPFIFNTIRDSSSQVSSDIVTTRIEIVPKSVIVNEFNEIISLEVRRLAGGSDIEGIKLILDKTNSPEQIVIDVPITLEELESKEITLSDYATIAEPISTIAIAPVLTNNIIGPLTPPYQLILAQPTAIPQIPKRLIHYQTVGFSDPNRVEFGKVATNIVNETDGWQTHIDNALTPLVTYLGPGTFDWWGHNPAGIWNSPIPYTPFVNGSMHIEQVDIAREQFPLLRDYRKLEDFFTENDMSYYAYVGFPRCDNGTNDAGHPFIFDTNNDFCNPTNFTQWYGEFVTNNFDGIGHDWSQNLPNYSLALQHNIPYLESNGMEIFIEAVPRRSHSHLLGFSVVASQQRWEFTEGTPELFFSEAELNAAGGRTLHLLGGQHIADIDERQAWRFNKSVELLSEGKTILVPLNQLLDAGYPIEELVALAQ